LGRVPGGAGTVVSDRRRVHGGLRCANPPYVIVLNANVIISRQQKIS
jgi:hypothetical protein